MVKLNGTTPNVAPMDDDVPTSDSYSGYISHLSSSLAVPSRATNRDILSSQS